jgi:ketosteroid isomerase-like protein
MSSPQENAVLASELLVLFQRGDSQALLARLDPEVEVFSTPELPNPGTFKGRDGYLQWIGPWLEAWESFEVEAEAVEPVGRHHVVVTVHQTGRGRGSGVEVEMGACYMAEFHDGLATRFHFYADREQALEAARAGEESAAEDS